MTALRITALIAVLAFVVGFVGYAVTRPRPSFRTTAEEPRP